MRHFKFLTVVVLSTIVLPGCAGLAERLPHADFHVGFAGLELGLDTRPVVSGAVTALAAAGAGAATGMTTAPDSAHPGSSTASSTTK